MRTFVSSLACLATLTAARPACAAIPVLPLHASWGSLGTGPGQFDWPADIAIAPNGNVYVVDQGNSRIQYFTPDGAYLGEWGRYGTGAGEFQRPRSIAVDAVGDVYVTDHLDRVQKFTGAGEYLTTFTDEHIYRPLGVAVDAQGNLYVGNSGPLRVVSKFDASGRFLMAFGSHTGWSVEVDSHGCVVVGNHSVYVQRFAPAGSLVAAWSPMGGLPEDNDFGVAVDGSDNVLVTFMSGWTGEVLVFSHELQRFDWWIPAAPPGGNEPWVQGIALDQEGFVYLSDFRNHAILKLRYSAPVPAVSSTWGQLKARYR